jgi:hypothetical protein
MSESAVAGTHEAAFCMVHERENYAGCSYHLDQAAPIEWEGIGDLIGAADIDILWRRWRHLSHLGIWTESRT